MQADRVREGAHQILGEVVLRKIRSGWGIDLSPDLSRQQLLLSQAESFLEKSRIFFVPVGVIAGNRQRIAHDPGDALCIALGLCF